jgi:SNARE protein
MTEEIRYYEEELSELVTEIQKGLDGLTKPKLTAAVKIERITEISSRLQRAKQVLHSFKVEMRDLPREHKAEYEIKSREFQQRLTTMHGEVQGMKQEAERQAIGVRTVDEMTTQEVLDEAGKVQSQSLSAVERMKRQIEESKQVGAATAARLQGQTEQLKNIDVDIQKVSSNLKRADLLLRAFMRKMVTDKIIMVFMCLILIGVLTIIVWKIVDPKGVEDANLNVPDEVVDPLGRGGDTADGAEAGAARRLRALRYFLHRARRLLDAPPRS